MKRVVTTAMFVFLLIGAERASAQGRPNSLRDGAWALQFMFENGLNGGSVLFKHHIGARDALRLGFSGRFSSADEELDYANVGTGDYESDSVNLGVDLMYLHYMGTVTSASFYVGAGPFVDLSEYTRSRLEQSVENGVYSDSSEEESTAIGLHVALGGEWFISESLSLAFEYAISASYRSYERNESYVFPGEPMDSRHWDGHSWNVDASRYGKIGVGIYF